MKYLAHSAKGGCPPQAYAVHVEGVQTLAKRYAQEAGAYAKTDGEQLLNIVDHTSEAHDIGKLEDENQTELLSTQHAQHLPVHHQDAGAALLLERDYVFSAFLVQSHHIGLNDLTDEAVREHMFRDPLEEMRTHVDRTLHKLAYLHEQLIRPSRDPHPEEIAGDQQVFLRMALSCLADADHTDTAIHYGQYPRRDDMPLLRAQERLEQLDRYVAALGNDNERSQLRREMYACCRDRQLQESFSTCDGPVGTGKTTAIMANLLRQALSRGARRIFVVLPYTSIISQSVKIYRKYLTLPGEDPEKAVAELHFRADYQHPDTRALTALWRSPIIVTTAVAFFETLASNKPATLRRLHELPGSMVFIDECHAALPVRLLPLAWHWMNVLAREWGCYWVLASGSLVRFWELEAFRKEQTRVYSLINDDLHQRLMHYEKHRVSFRWASVPKSRRELVDWVQSQPGPRLLIVNTIQTAAVLANDFRKAYGRNCVEHLSTALSAQEREATVERVIKRLANSADSDWTLVATSCVEAGVDFSFRTGFRELSSLVSLLQTAGRINRDGLYLDAQVWSFVLQDDPLLTQNPTLQTASWVLQNYFAKGIEITPELSTRSLQDELIADDSVIKSAKKPLAYEEDGAFRTLAETFSVIDSDMVVIIPDEALAEQIRNGHADWQMLQRRGVSIARKKAQLWQLEEIAPDIYRWERGYDGFLGYMAGVIE